jgi:hypothetical protein
VCCGSKALHFIEVEKVGMLLISYLRHHFRVLELFLGRSAFRYSLCVRDFYA